MWGSGIFFTGEKGFSYLERFGAIDLVLPPHSLGKEVMLVSLESSPSSSLMVS